ncbi:unnamed protein product [Prunus armeniaca]
MKRTKVAAVVHKSAAAGMWTDICILGCDAAGVLGLLPEQKLTVVIRMLAYRASTDQLKLCTLGTTCVDLLPGTSNDFYKKPKLEDFQELLVASTAYTGNGRIAQQPCKVVMEIEKAKKYHLGSRCLLRHMGLTCLLWSCRIPK